MAQAASSGLLDLKVWEDLQAKIEDDTKIRDVGPPSPTPDPFPPEETSNAMQNLPLSRSAANPGHRAGPGEIR